MMKVAVNDTNRNLATNIRQQIEELKRQKAKRKVSIHQNKMSNADIA